MSEAADLTPAIVGLLGVVVGSFIPATFAVTKARNDEARMIREYVTKFRHKADWYLRFVGDVRAARAKGERHASQGGGEMSRRFSAALEAGHALIGASPDGKVAAQAERILSHLAEYMASHKGAFDRRPKVEGLSREPIDHELAVLHHMVTPRWYEFHFRFRRASRAAKLVTKSKAGRSHA